MPMSDWNAAAIVAARVVTPWSGRAWRIHDRKYSPVDSAGSLKVSGRFNRGLDQFPAKQTWAVLYLALQRDVALAEMIRHLNPQLLARVKNRRITELWLDLGRVIDCRDLERIGVSAEAFFHDIDYHVPQELGKAALERGMEAMLVPSASLLGDNLIVFDRNLREGSRIEIVSSVDPRLYIEQSS